MAFANAILTKQIDLGGKGDLTYKIEENPKIRFASKEILRYLDTTPLYSYFNT